MNARSPIVRIVSLLAIALAPLSWAQPAQSTGIIEGRVFNPATGEYVSNAEVTLSGTSLLATTSNEGRYRLANVPSGNATITVRYAGYPTATANVAVAAGGLVTRDFEMQSDSSGVGQVVRMGAVTVEEVREGMAKALMEQRSSMVIKNVINSDTFGDMVDGNIGEILQFVPGIDIEYGASGGAQSVISRGLGNEYTALMIDGVRTPAGTLQGNRRPEFDNVSGNSMESIEVTKTNSAEMDADAPGGTINIRSRNAFTRKERSINWQLFGTFGSLIPGLGKSNGPNDGEMHKTVPGLSVDYSEVFLDQKFAVSLNLSDMWATSVSAQVAYAYNTAPTTANPTPALLTSATYTDNTGMTRRRSGGMNLQYKLTPTLVIALRGNFNLQDTESFSRQFRLQSNRASLAAGSGPTVMIANPTTNTNTRMDLLGNHTIRGRDNHMIYPTLTYTGKRLKADATYSFSRGGQVLTNGYPGSDLALVTTDMLLTGVGFVVEKESRGSNRMQFRQTSGPDLYNLNNWRPTSAAYNMVRAPADTRTGAVMYQGNAELETEWSVPVTFKTGVKFLEGSFLRTLGNYAYSYVGPTGNRLTADLPVSPYRNNVNYAPFEETNLFTDRQIPYPDRTVLGERMKTNPEYFVENPANATNATNLLPKRYAKEKLGAGYLMATGRVRSLMLQGGARYEETSSNALVFERGQQVYRSGSYDDVFFSGAARYRFTDRLMAISSFSQSIKRPTLASMSGVASFNDTNLTGNMPNPELRAEHGNNYSTRLEYYFEPVGFIAAGVFWMDIKDLHLNNQLPAEELGLGNEYPGYIFTTTTNAGDVRIEGYELEYRQMLTFLPDALRGFGVFASYSTNRYSDAAIRLAITGGQPTTGSGSYGLTFRRGPFSSALRASHRPEAQSNPTTLNPPLTRVNFTADYQFSPKLTFFVSGRNITDAPAFNNTSVPVEGATVTYRQHGVIWVFGVKGRL